MAILQALLALVSKSAGKILNAIFGWAVRALFGQTSVREQTFLSAVVGAAVAWPILLFGLIAPRIASVVLAFVPIPHWIPTWAVRIVWLVLAMVVPLAVGLAVAAKAPPDAPREAFLKRVARGFPITIGLAAAFLIMFVSVPVMRFAALVRKQKSADVPLITDVRGYHEVAGRLCAVLARHGFALASAKPDWWVAAPSRILSWLGGGAFRAYVPQDLEHFVSPEMTMSLYPSGVLLRGEKARITLAHGLIAETVVHADGFQTTDPEAQDLERQLRQLWKIYDEYPSAHTASKALLGRLRAIASDLTRLDVDFDDWQVIYRQILQVERAVRGQHQLMDEQAAVRGGEEARAMDEREKGPVPDGDARTHETGDLIREVVSEVGLLVRKEIDLAKTELSVDLRAEAKMAGGLGVAAVAALTTLNLLLVTAILALSAVLPAWGAGLLVTGLMLAVALIVAAVSWRKRVRTPLQRTRRSWKETVRWTKERMA